MVRIDHAAGKLEIVLHNYALPRRVTLYIGSAGFDFSADLTRNDAERLSNALSVGATRLALADAAAAVDSEGGEIG